MTDTASSRVRKYRDGRRQDLETRPPAATSADKKRCMSSREQRAQALVDQVDDATARLLSNQLKLVRLASNKDKSLITVGSETTEIEACTASIVRAVEELLVISRGLKEAWVLGQIREPAPPLSEEEQTRRAAIVQKCVAVLGSSSEWA